MNDKKNIDRLFQEKFKDFEVAPNDAVWNRISESLPNKKKKRRVIALWWQIGGVAAVITLLLTVGLSVFNNNDNENLPIVDTDKTDSIKKDDSLEPSLNSEQEKLNTDENSEKIKFVDSDTYKKSINRDQNNTSTKKDQVSNPLFNSNKQLQKSNAIVNNSKQKKKTNVVSQKNIDLITGNNEDDNTKIAENINSTNAITNSKENATSQLTKESELKSTTKNTIENSKTVIADNSASQNSGDENNANTTKSTDELNIENTLVEETNKKAIEEAIAENSLDEKEEEKQNRWSIAPNVAPVYYSSLGKGSSLDKQFNENAKSSDINMSYGITGTYAVSKKIKLRAGINRVNLSQTTSDVFAFTGAETAARGTDAQFSNIKFNGEIAISLMSSKMLDRSTAPEIFNTKIAGDIDQKFGFIEVPLELEYRLLDKKFGLNVIGGFSTFFLNQNDVYADINGTSTLIGEADNLNSTSFSANFGFGMDYSLSKQWNINLEPTFKYQINTFNNTSGNFNPFFIGVYTGLSFKF